MRRTPRGIPIDAVCLQLWEIDNVPQPIHIIGPQVFIFQVVGVFPYVKDNQGLDAVRHDSVLVFQIYNAKPIAAVAR